jgi:hypothetical protein
VIAMGRIKRLEFSKDVKMQMFRRAGGPGNVCCEGCGMPLRGKLFEYDHTLECWEMENLEHGLRPPLTAADGKLLGKDCCHKPKTAKKAGERAKGVRILEDQARIDRRKTNKKYGKSSRFKRKMDGTVIDRETGEVVSRR